MDNEAIIGHIRVCEYQCSRFTAITATDGALGAAYTQAAA